MCGALLADVLARPRTLVFSDFAPIPAANQFLMLIRRSNNRRASIRMGHADSMLSNRKQVGSKARLDSPQVQVLTLGHLNAVASRQRHTDNKPLEIHPKGNRIY